MKIFAPFIVLLMVAQACKQPAQNHVAASAKKDSISSTVMDSFPAVKPTVTPAHNSLYSLDISVNPFDGDTAVQIERTLALISAIDKKTAKAPRDTFSVFEKTTEGCAIIIIKDSIGIPIKFYGSIFGETGRIEFSYYMLPGNPQKLLATVVTDINYNGSITQEKSKVSSQKATYGIYAGNALVALLNTKKQRQKISAKELEHAELDARELFNDYIGQIESGTKPDRN